MLVSNGNSVLNDTAANTLRAVGAGYSAAVNSAAVQADKTVIHPFEGASRALQWMRDKTANVRVLGKLTGLLNTAGGFLLLAQASQPATRYRTMGDGVVDITHSAADLIDGKKTTPFSPYLGGPREVSETTSALFELGAQ